MKRFVAVILLLAFTFSFLASCGDTTDEQSKNPEENSMITNADDLKKVWDEDFADESNGFADIASISKLTAFSNGKVYNDLENKSGDVRYLFEGKDNTRVAVLSEGYALTLPSKGVKADFSLGALRSKYETDDYTLTVTFENKNTYGADENGWEIYYREWLARWIDTANYDEAKTFLDSNGIAVTREPTESETLLDGFVVNRFDLNVRFSMEMEQPYYSIAIVRPADHYRHFWLFVMKSDEAVCEKLDDIVASFKEIEKNGTPVNNVGSYELKIPEYWSDETKAYYNKLLNQTTVDIGAFHEGKNEEYIEWLSSEEGIGSDLDVFMDYLHVGWYGASFRQLGFEKEHFNKYAGGNGFNGKPVLELTYQFTTTNNVLGGYTPMYDISRGRLDKQFRDLAKSIKEYSKPVLFRLNNEMNTDWTSYSGIQTLLDPDIFINTWRRLYDIFREEGVDNCIFIFNPFTPTCPYSNWGETLNYFPGEDYVQMIGLTYYQMNNDETYENFAQMYKRVYEDNTPYFDNYPAIIGEFACGAGGEVKYNHETGAYEPVIKLEQKKQWQAAWIDDMFNCFMKNQEEGYEFCKNIKIAAWFSCNDYNANGQIINYLKLDEGVPLALQAFREGYAELKAKRGD